MLGFWTLRLVLLSGSLLVGRWCAWTELAVFHLDVHVHVNINGDVRVRGWSGSGS
jgi:hypothetical protein